MKATLKELTWKYFIQKKMKEIVMATLIIIAVIFIPYFLGNSIGDNRDAICDNECGFSETCNPNAECDNIDAWFEGLFYLVFGAMALTIIIIILYKWLSSNWEKAEYKAELEFNSQKRRKTQ